MDKAAGIADARSKIDHILWYVPHYTPSIPQQGIISKQVLSKTPTDLTYIERAVSSKQVKTQNLLNFESNSQQSMKVTIKTIIGFQQRDRQDSQNLKNDTFLDYQLLVLNVSLGQEPTLMLA